MGERVVRASSDRCVCFRTVKQVLYLGGTGTISAACVQRSLDAGQEVTVLNRGSGRRPLPDGVRELTADVRDPESLASALDGREFDVVADFLSFTPDHVGAMLDQFEGRSGQYVFVSSASAYQKPLARSPITEETPLSNPFWSYSRDKIACEELLVRARDERGLPMTIVRPSHTYDGMRFPNIGRWTDIVRMRAGRPVIIPGDGTTHWTLTHSSDFAVGFVGLLGLPAALGEAVHITSPEAPTWNQIYAWLAEAAGVEDPRFVHVSSEMIAAADPELGPGLLGDKSHSLVFDVSKIRSLVPEFDPVITFDEGARMILANAESGRAVHEFDAGFDAVSDRLAALWASAGEA
jgi:nucleoside-diphosphate-sugar epimerase